jgi:excisionase family DNA binding protein
VAQVAHRLGCASWTVHRLIKRGRFPGAFQLEREWRVPVAAVDAFLSDDCSSRSTCSVPHNETG